MYLTMSVGVHCDCGGIIVVCRTHFEAMRLSAQPFLRQNLDCLLTMAAAGQVRVGENSGYFACGVQAARIEYVLKSWRNASRRVYPLNIEQLRPSDGDHRESTLSGSSRNELGPRLIRGRMLYTLKSVKKRCIDGRVSIRLDHTKPLSGLRRSLPIFVKVLFHSVTTYYRMIVSTLSTGPAPPSTMTITPGPATSTSTSLVQE